MYTKENPDKGFNPQRDDRGDTQHTGETFDRSQEQKHTKEMREANENARKSQGDDAGHRRAIDRDR